MCTCGAHSKQCCCLVSEYGGSFFFSQQMKISLMVCVPVSVSFCLSMRPQVTKKGAVVKCRNISSSLILMYMLIFSESWRRNLGTWRRGKGSRRMGKGSRRRGKWSRRKPTDMENCPICRKESFFQKPVLSNTLLLPVRLTGSLPLPSRKFPLTISLERAFW